MMSVGWLWLYLGAFLMLMEFFAPGLIIFFFGMSAATVGVIKLAAGDAFSATWQVVAFTAFSLFYLLSLRRWLKNIFMGERSESRIDLGGDYIGRTGTVVAAVNPPEAGRVIVGDSEWNAVGETAIEAGVSVKVVGQQNLTLKVEHL
jgi:membrane protein implicated in regulation of membrane protease activity